MKALLFQHVFQILEHAGAAANHHSVAGRIECGQLQVFKHLAAFHQIGNAPHVAVALAGYGGVIQQLFGDQLPQKLVLRQVVHHQVVVSQLIGLAHAVHQHDLLEALISLRVADDAHERRQAGSCGQQVQAFAGQQVVNHQRAGRFAADDDLVANLHVLQARGQGAVGHLDAQEFKVFLVVRAHDAVSAKQGLVIDAQTDHGEVAVAEAQ